MKLDSLCVFCGSADGLAPKYLDAASRMGTSLAHAGITLVFGAGKTGMMGAIAQSALNAGGKVIGVVPRSLNTPVLIHSGLTRLVVTSGMHSRKQRMIRISDGFIALPGGYGTVDEWFEVLTLAQIGVMQKPVGLLNVDGFFNPLLAWIDLAIAEKFIYPEHRDLFISRDSPEELIEGMRIFSLPSNLARWVNR